MATQVKATLTGYANYDTRLAYAGFLNRFSWDYFTTVTFKHPRKDTYYAADDVWDSLSYYGAERGFIAVEPHILGDIHCHGISWHPFTRTFDWKNERILDVSPLRDRYYLAGKMWSGLFHSFGRNKVDVLAGAESVSAYCAKYVTKPEALNFDYYFFGDPGAWVP